MFYRSVVLESGDVVGGGLDAQDESKFVVDFDRGFAEAMLDAGALDPGCELTADLLGELAGDLVAEEGGHVFGLTVRMALRLSRHRLTTLSSPLRMKKSLLAGGPRRGLPQWAERLPPAPAEHLARRKFPPRRRANCAILSRQLDHASSFERLLFAA